MRLFKRQRLGDFHHLARGEGKCGAALAGVDVEMDLLQLLGCSLVHARLGDEAEAQELLLTAKEDVFSNREARQHRLLLKHHRDAGIEGLTWRGNADLAAIDEDAPGIWLVDAVKDLEQRGLAGTVLADQPHHLAAVDVEADVIQRLHTRERFGDAADFEDGGAHLTTSSRERSRASATAAMMRSPCTPFCT